MDADLFYPLNEFYQRAGLPLPAVEKIAVADLPEPYHTLLAHQEDMPPILAKHHGMPIRLRVIKTHREKDTFARQVILVRDDGRPVTIAALKFYLSALPEDVGKSILDNKLVLGDILRQRGIFFVSTPLMFLRATSDKFMDDLMGLRGPVPLYGHRGIYADLARTTFAEIIEFMAPEE
jgi:hypothetical protein